MKYTITYKNTFNEPYYTDTNSKCQHMDIDQWTVDNKDLCMKVLKDLLDVPEKALTPENIREEFGSVQYPISDKKVTEIQNYYNGRLNIYNSLIAELKTANIETLIHHDIEEQYNSFNVADDLNNIKQIESYIEVTITE